jgi:hypothetical protein
MASQLNPLTRSGLPVPAETALAASGGRMPERSCHRASGGQDARSERPARRHGQPRATQDVASIEIQQVTVPGEVSHENR